jgi:hypothetical protein
MSRSIIAGMTNYEHQSIEDMKHDLRDWLSSLTEVLDFLTGSVDKLKTSGYWDKTVTYDIAGLFGDSIKFYETSIGEITEIIAGINTEIEPHHINRVRALGKSANELNRRFGYVWHRGDVHKDYENPEFSIVEQMYGRGRDMAVDMMDLTNLAVRLEDFVGRKGKEVMKIHHGISSTKTESRNPEDLSWQSYRNNLQSQIAKHFNREELKSLCFHLNIAYDDLPGEGNKNKARELILFSIRNNRLNELRDQVIKERPLITVPEMPQNTTTENT